TAAMARSPLRVHCTAGRRIAEGFAALRYRTSARSSGLARPLGFSELPARFVMRHPGSAALLSVMACCVAGCSVTSQHLHELKEIRSHGHCVCRVFMKPNHYSRRISFFVVEAQKIAGEQFSERHQEKPQPIADHRPDCLHTVLFHLVTRTRRQEVQEPLEHV